MIRNVASILQRKGAAEHAREEQAQRQSDRIHTVLHETLQFSNTGFPLMSENTKTIDQTKVFNEKLNGRLAMLGLTIGLVTEALTGNGIIQQVFGFFKSSIGSFL